MYEKTDDEGTDEMSLDKSDEIRRRQKYKFQSVVVTVLKTPTSSHCEKVIEWMEVWPAKLERSWEFKWSDMFNQPTNPKNNATSTVLLISFTTFLRPG
jgi:hypothetical protein